MLNFAIRGHDLTSANTPQQLAAQIKKVGIHNVQLALSASFPELSVAEKMNPGLGTFFKQQFQNQGIQIALLSCYSNLIHPDLSVREQILKKFEVYLAHAHYFGAAMVASETGSVLANLGYSEENFKDEVFHDLLKVLKRLVKSAEQSQTLIGIEAGLNHPLYSNQRITQLIQEVSSPQLGIIYDPTNLITAANYQHQVQLVQEAFESFGEKIVCLHLKDFQIIEGKVQKVPLGEGLIRYREVLEIVQAYKLYCYTVLEGTQDEKIPLVLKLLAE